MKIRNPKINSNPLTDRTFLDVPSSNSYQYVHTLEESWELRHYYEYNNCVSNGGRVFYVTLTYAEHSLPYFEGLSQFPCPDWRNVRWLLHECDFMDTLKSSFCVGDVRYFIATELGEGKGERGYHKNPHYHCIFFLYPSVGSPLSNTLTGDSFLRLVAHYWQGHYYKYNGLCLSYAQMKSVAGAFSSPAWWSALKSPVFYSNTHFKDKMRFGMVSAGSEGCEVSRADGASVYCSKYCVKDVSERLYYKEVYNYFFDKWCEEHTDSDGYPCFGYEEMSRSDFEAAASSYASDYLKKFKRYHSTRVHTSNGFGACMLDSLVSLTDPRVPFSKNGKQYFRSLPTYAFRKLFYDFNPQTRLYTPNTKYYDYTISQSPKRVSKLFKTTFSALNSLCSNVDSFKTCEFSKNEIDTLKDLLALEKLPLNFSNVVYRFCVYKIYYENLCFDNSIGVYVVCPTDDLCLRFSLLQDSEDCTDRLVPFSEHPEFNAYLDTFVLLDKCLSCFSQIQDESNLMAYLERKKTQRAVKDYKYRSGKVKSYVLR